MKLCKDNLLLLTKSKIIKYDLDFKIIKEIDHHISDPYSLNITKDNNYLAIGCENSANLEIFEYKELAKIQTMEVHKHH